MCVGDSALSFVRQVVTSSKQGGATGCEGAVWALEADKPCLPHTVGTDNARCSGHGSQMGIFGTPTQCLALRESWFLYLPAVPTREKLQIEFTVRWVNRRQNNICILEGSLSSSFCRFLVGLVNCKELIGVAAKWEPS